MKPYGKTYRASKIHKANECGVCSEAVGGGANHERQQSKKEINSGDLERDDVLQEKYNKDADFEDFVENY